MKNSFNDRLRKDCRGFNSGGIQHDGPQLFHSSLKFPQPQRRVKESAISLEHNVSLLPTRDFQRKSFSLRSQRDDKPALVYILLRSSLVESCLEIRVYFRKFAETTVNAMRCRFRSIGSFRSTAIRCRSEQSLLRLIQDSTAFSHRIPRVSPLTHDHSDRHQIPDERI